ncbi:Mu transposase C-terminal domain-containing protein [Sphingomonas sp. 10B4]|nr:Mu transposase C-terminal domain-containing protein [Sphingomonas sp. 10B4]MDY7522838.1 Mu transposase C-terminal domain-containing protein [Sphingomonas sp. 10B4]MEB0284262.1 Mu transposase C-terminal domain-containing protein [Sphingomonas sp. 10B4]
MVDHRKPESGSAEVPKRMALLRRHLFDAVPLGEAAIDAGISTRTAHRWLTRYRADGPAGLARPIRPEAGKRTFPRELVELIEGMALLKPPPSIVTIHRRLAGIVGEREWQMPSYGSVRDIVRRIDPAMLTLAHEGAAAFRDKFELVHRHRAERPNAIWQADHTQLDILILDADGRQVRPWLTTVLDDHSRVIAGYMVFVGAPSALNTSLALRQAVWRKADPAWPVCGIPDVPYVDHGSDFTSLHLEQAAADLRIRLIYSAVARPQGRGKIERLFRTINTELLAELPGNLRNGKPVSPPRLTLPALDAAIGAYIVATYNVRPHRAIGVPPVDAWRGDGWLSRMPETLEELDSLLVMVAKPRIVHRDGIRFEGLRYFNPTLAAYVGEPVTVRYDPRDVGEVRVFHRNAFLCRAVSPDHAGLNITLKDVQSARLAYRRRVRSEIEERKARVADYLPAILRPPGSGTKQIPTPKPAPATPAEAVRSKPRLRTYYEGE